MTRKDYNILAEALKDSNADIKICQSIANALDRNYANFNYDRFIRACRGE